MSLTKATITGSELPASDMYAYAKDGLTGGYYVFKATQNAVSAKLLGPLPPTAFDGVFPANYPASITCYPGGQTISKILCDPYIDRIAAISAGGNAASHSGNIAVCTDMGVLAKTTSSNYDVYSSSQYCPIIPEKYISPYLIGGINMATGGPSNAITYHYPFTASVYLVAPYAFFLSWDEVTIENGVVKVYDAINISSVGIFGLLNRTTGRCFTINPARTTLSYLTLAVPSGGEIISLLSYNTRLMYLVRKADTTTWLYDATNGGAEVMQLDDGTFDATTALKFAVMF